MRRLAACWRGFCRRRLPAAMLPALLCMAALPASAQYSEPALGRLFTAPDERMRLDRDRASVPASTVPDAVSPPLPEPAAETAPAPPPAPVRLTGVIRRSDGRATVLVGDEPRAATLPDYRAGAAIPIDMPGGRVLVKPGQSIDPTDGTILER